MMTNLKLVKASEWASFVALRKEAQTINWHPSALLHRCMLSTLRIRHVPLLTLGSRGKAIERSESQRGRLQPASPAAAHTCALKTSRCEMKTPSANLWLAAQHNSVFSSLITFAEKSAEASPFMVSGCCENDFGYHRAVKEGLTGCVLPRRRLSCSKRSRPRRPLLPLTARARKR